MSIAAILRKTFKFSAHRYEKPLIKFGKTQIQFYTTSIAAHHSFLYDPPKEDRGSPDSLKQVTPKEVLPLLQAIRQKNTKESWKLYSELCDKNQLYLLSPLQHSRLLNVFSFNKTFDEKQRHYLGNQLLFIFNKMKFVGIEPDINDFTHMMNTFSLIGNSRVCDKLWKDITKKKIQPNIFMFNSYIVLCWQLIRSKKGKEKDEGLRKAQKILTSLRNSDREPTLVTNCYLIRLFISSNDLENAYDLLKVTFSQNNLSSEITRSEISRYSSITYHTFNYLMNAFGVTGDLLMMDECFQIFLRTKLPPHIYMFNTLVRSSSRIDTDKAKDYIKMMVKEFNIKPTHQIFTYILVNLAYRKEFTREAMELLNVMEDEYKYPPTKFMLVPIYKTLLRKRRYDEAKEFLSKYYNKSIM